MGERLDNEKLSEMYELMLRIRLFEERANQLFLKGLLPGSIHTSIGQEAVAVGVCEALREEDIVIGSHRSHGLCVAKGMEIEKMFAELLGKKNGICRGKAGSMHIMDASRGMLGATGIVGAQMPIAAGIGLAIKMKKTGQVCACFFGDGASNTGAFHEALNFAAIWKLPVVFVCENNLYALSGSFLKTTSVKDIAERGKAYDIPGVLVDGMDVTAVYESAIPAIKRARDGKGPTLVECKTYRFLGHSRADPRYGPYRTKDEWESWKERDPLRMLERALHLSRNDIEGLESRISSEYDEAIEFAKASPYPDVESCLEDIHC